MTVRLGIMGGTFDPIHHGHLVCAEEALHALQLDSVLFVPAGAPWQKEGRVMSSAEDRYVMVCLAAGGDARFAVSRQEMDRAGPTYTVDTLRALRHEHHEPAELFFLAGSDAVAQISTWRQPDEVMDLATVVAAARPGHELPLTLANDPRIRVLPIPQLAISSSDIRSRVASGLPWRYMVPKPVADYVSSRGLYAGHS
ncbi:MAG TPA: nicotinate-nucleotide adenylyltransferase [Actinomycetota bacterium]|nr:nicotinate-nucleotide adenylyltransferase [Actinomycetota bacterium]